MGGAAVGAAGGVGGVGCAVAAVATKAKHSDASLIMMGSFVRKVFFFEKKNQKTFILSRVRRRVRDSRKKVFCFFSSEKKSLPF